LTSSSVTMSCPSCGAEIDQEKDYIGADPDFSIILVICPKCSLIVREIRPKRVRLFRTKRAKRGKG